MADSQTLILYLSLSLIIVTPLIDCKSCENITDTSLLPNCLNGGVCNLSNVNQTQCICEEYWTGNNCQLERCGIGHCLEFEYCNKAWCRRLDGTGKPQAPIPDTTSERAANNHSQFLETAIGGGIVAGLALLIVLTMFGLYVKRKGIRNICKSKPRDEDKQPIITKY